MKILFEARSIIPGRSGGIENYLYMLVNAWKSEFKEDQIFIHIPPGTRPDYEKKISGVVFLTDPVYEKVAKLSKQFFLLRLILKIIVKVFPPAEIFMFGLRPKWISEMDSKVNVIIYPFQREKYVHDSSKTIFVMHDFREWDSDKGEKRIMQEQIKAIQKSAAIVVSWPYPYKRMTEIFPDSKSKLYEIPFLYDPFIESELNTGNIKGDYLYYPSANAVHKNHENLIKGLSLYNNSNPDKKLSLICTGPIDKKRQIIINSLIDDFGAKKDIEFLGFVSRDKVFELYKNCLAVVTSSKYEAFSGAILEAYKFKKPAIASSILPNTNFLDRYNLELNLFDPNDPSSIKLSIENLVSNYSKDLKLSVTGFDTLKHITPAYTVSKFRDIAKKVIIINN
jgi:glycosyltransferase involved in cell wall biosynthesis